MTKQKTTKRPLLSSVLSLVLCMAMLVGTTFAWFTDSVTSGNNIIKSGNLDVNLYYWDNSMATGTNVSIQEKPDTKLFKNVNGEDILWEPGATGFGQFEVANEGSLALTYQLKLNFYNATETAPGSGKTLADVLSVYAVARNGNTGADDVMGDASLESLRTTGIDSYVPGYEAQTLTDFMLEGYLLPGESFIYELGAFWEPTANDNDYNVAGGLSIDFGVTLVATQMTYEEDSYDDQYDADAIKDGIRVEENGLVILYTDDEVYLEDVTSAFVGDTVEVPAGVTSIGYGSEAEKYGRQVFASNLNVKNVIIPATVKTIAYQAFKDSAVESVTLPEGLTEIGDFAFNGATKLANFNIPSTVTKIGKRAFRLTAATEVVLHAGIESITESFRDMPNLTTVTVEGNVAFDNYAFRRCPNLTSIYLLGDDVQFTGSQFATHADNGDANGITIYVKNATVAARVYAAQTSAHGYEVKILGDSSDGSDAQEVVQAKNNTQLDTAIAGGASTVVLGSGNFIIPDSAQGKTLTIVGNGNTVVANQNDGSYEGCDYSLDGATVTFEGVTINTDGHTYAGYARCKGTYNNCTINGSYTLYGESEFNNCTFNVTGDYYNIWTWGAKTVEFNGCTFNTSGKSILVYNQSCDVYVNGCTFNDRTNGTGFTKSALETGVDGVGPKYNIHINDTSVNGFAENDKCVGYKNVVGNKNSLTNEYLNIVIDGVDVF